MSMLGLANKIKLQSLKSTSVAFGRCVYLSKTIVFGEEVGPLPINNFSLGLFFGMDIGFVKHHDVFVLQVVGRSLLCFAITSLFLRKRRIAGLGKKQADSTSDLKPRQQRRLRSTNASVLAM